jgi:prevent-host-death family protein
MCYVVTHMASVVGVRELRQNLSKYLARVKQGEDLEVTERGQVVARLIPAGSSTGTSSELAVEFGATLPVEPLEAIALRLRPPGALGGTTDKYLDDTRADRGH